MVIVLKIFLMLALILVLPLVLVISESFAEESNSVNQTYTWSDGYGYFYITYKISNGEIQDIGIPCKEGFSLIISPQSTIDGTFEIEIPRGLLDAKNRNDVDGEFFVLLDGEETKYDEIKNNESRNLKFFLSNDINEIEIIGWSMESGMPGPPRFCNKENVVYQFHYLFPPKKQIQNGITLENILCSSDFELISKSSDNSPACVKPDSVQKLIERGWGKFIILL